jgi:hypothetical protein
MVNFEKIKEGINQSTLKTIHFLPSKMEEDTSLFYEERECLVLGNAIDCYLLTPHLFQENFYIDELKNKPPAAVMSFIQELLAKGLNYNEYHIINNIELLNYQNNWKNSTKIEYLLKPLCVEYADNIIQAGDRQILSKEEFDIVQTVCDNFLNHKHTGNYFKSEDYECQLLLKGNIEGFNFYGTLDRININKWDKTIQPFDIKTTGEYTVNFDRVFKRFKYYYQDIIYTELLKQNYPDYTILPFVFLVESVKFPGLPLVYSLDDESRELAKAEVMESLSILNWHISNNISDMPKYIYDVQGHLKIKL